MVTETKSLVTHKFIFLRKFGCELINNLTIQVVGRVPFLDRFQAISGLISRTDTSAGGKTLEKITKSKMRTSSDFLKIHLSSSTTKKVIWQRRAQIAITPFPSR